MPSSSLERNALMFLKQREERRGKATSKFLTHHNGDVQFFRCLLATGRQVDSMAKHCKLPFTLSTNIADEDTARIESNTEPDRGSAQGEMLSSSKHFLRTFKCLLYWISLAWCYSPQR